MSLLTCRRRGVGKSLPYDAEVEYLRNSGEEYIYVPIEFKNNWLWHIDFMRISNHYNFVSVMYGTPNKVGFWTSGYRGCTCRNGDKEVVLGDIRAPINMRVQIDVNVDTIKFSWTETQKTMTYVNYTIDGITLFSRRTDDKGIYNIYNFYVKDENGIIRINLIPVRIGNVGYLYDKVSGQLFGNSGTGNFILGADK